MLGRLWKKKVKAPNKEQLRQAKALGIKSASQMSQATLTVIIKEAQRKRGAGPGSGE